MKPHQARAVPTTSGYTLIELMTVLAILAAVAALAAPSLAALGRGQELEAAAVGVARLLRTAQSRALVTGDRVRVAARRDARGSWVFPIERERGGAWLPDGASQALPPGTVVAVAGPAEKVFNPDGTCSLGSITVRSAGAVYRCTLAPATGRVRFYRGDREAGRGR
jgi:general secretion pathway protein H